MLPTIRSTAITTHAIFKSINPQKVDTVGISNMTVRMALQLNKITSEGSFHPF